MAAAEPSVQRAPADGDDESARWVEELGGTGPSQTAAAVRLHELLLRVAHGELRRRAGALRLSGPELDDLAYQAAADAAMAILSKLTTFRGESRFTTWAYRFAILEVSTKVGRHFWRHPPANFDADLWERLPDRFGVDPAGVAQARDLADAIRHAVEHDLSERQRRVFVAIVLQDVSLDVLAVELASTRNALYKTMFDARRKLRTVLAANGYLTDDSPRHR